MPLPLLNRRSCFEPGTAGLRFGALPTARLGRFPYLAAVECAANPLRAVAAPPKPILAFRAIRGMPGVNKDSHQERKDRRQGLNLGQMAVQKRYKRFWQVVSG